MVLSAVVFMVLLMAASASLAFADPPEKWGHKCHEENEKIGINDDGNCGFHYSKVNR
jgi:hypothetical protein